MQLLRHFEADGRLERCAAGITLPEVADPAAIDALRPFRNVNALAALRTFNHRTRTRKSRNIARHFHGAPPDKLNRGPVSTVFLTLVHEPRANEAVALTYHARGS